MAKVQPIKNTAPYTETYATMCCKAGLDPTEGMTLEQLQKIRDKRQASGQNTPILNRVIANNEGNDRVTMSDFKQGINPGKAPVTTTVPVVATVPDDATGASVTSSDTSTTSTEDTTTVDDGLTTSFTSLTPPKRPLTFLEMIAMNDYDNTLNNNNPFNTGNEDFIKIPSF